MMPEYRNKEVSFAFDMYGCPNRCRHCWLGCASIKIMPKDEVFEQFVRIREYIDNELEKPHLERVKYFCSWFREPDYSDDYKELYEKELEFNDGVAVRKNYELLSIWRIARDEEYLKWIKNTGVRKCQITLFGINGTNDWFYRRRGAFEDAVKASLKLLDNGIVPRWQLFQTRKILPELDEILRVVEKFELRKRAEEIGGKFVLFMHDPSPLGEAIKLESIRITSKDLKLIPRDIIASTEKHFNRQELYFTEGHWLSEIEKGQDAPIGFSYPEVLWFFVDSNWDVFPNTASLESWWKLGNLKKDALSTVFGNYLKNKTIALDLLTNRSAKDMARLYGDRKSDKIYMSENDMIGLYVEKYCRDHVNGI